MVRKNKKGWIKIVEAFLSILLLMGVFFIVINNQDFEGEKEAIIETQESLFLESIQLNSSLRQEVLDSPVPKNSTEEDFSFLLNAHLSAHQINNFDCFLKICSVQDDCTSNNIQKEIYTKEVLITSTNTEYNPRKLKLFCEQ